MLADLFATHENERNTGRMRQQLRARKTTTSPSTPLYFSEIYVDIEVEVTEKTKEVVEPYVQQATRQRL